jgi:hypothetical protein
LEDLRRLFDRELGRWLIQNEELGTEVSRARDRDRLPLAAGEIHHRFTGVANANADSCSAACARAFALPGWKK